MFWFVIYLSKGNTVTKISRMLTQAAVLYSESISIQSEEG